MLQNSDLLETEKLFKEYKCSIKNVLHHQNAATLRELCVKCEKENKQQSSFSTTGQHVTGI